MSTYKALYLSPMIPSFNLNGTINFFREVLDFTPVLDTATYAVVQKNNLAVHILQAGKNIGQMEFYLEVDNVDRLWAAIKEKTMGLKLKEPFDRDYGMREIHLEIPYTKALLFIGHDMAKQVT